MQRSFADLEQDNPKKVTGKRKFLRKMEKALPWKQLTDAIRDRYPDGKRGRPPYPLEVMLRIYFMKLWYNLSDPGMEDALYESVSIRQFAGVEMNTIPDETTILNFCHFIDRCDYGK